MFSMELVQQVRAHLLCAVSELIQIMTQMMWIIDLSISLEKLVLKVFEQIHYLWKIVSVHIKIFVLLQMGQ